jgi:predicted ATPase
MQKIKIKNFGPIANAEIEIKKAVVLIGGQGSGKSTIIKLISTFMWLEKDLYRSTVTGESDFEKYFQVDVKKLLAYHRIDDYFKENTEIVYQGLAFKLSFSNDKFHSEKTGSDFIYPQIIYIPATRNLTFQIDNLKVGNYIHFGLRDFIGDFQIAASNFKYPLKLPFSKAEITKGEFNTLRLKEDGEYDIKLSDASSGFQAVAPMLLLAEYLQKKMTDGNYGEKNSDAPKATSFVNIVEEPEQNLFPETQMQVVKSLVEICNRNDNNKLIISTHSPYVLATINNLILAGKAGQKFPKKVAERVNENLWLNKKDVFAAIVENGTVDELIDEDFDMIPMEQLDAVSRIINDEFDYLYQYETADNTRM